MNIIKLFFVAVAIVTLGFTPVFASYVDTFTTDTEIRAALTMLEQANADEVFANLEENSVKIAFYDLSMISFDYFNHFAINSTDSFGNRYILINTKYKRVSTEELACLIVHESFHKADVATLEEETLATQKEAYYWGLLKDPDKTYKDSRLLSRLNTLVELFQASDSDCDLIKEKIANTSFYIQQLAIIH